MCVWVDGCGCVLMRSIQFIYKCVRVCVLGCVCCVCVCEGVCVRVCVCCVCVCEGVCVRVCVLCVCVLGCV